MGADDSGEGKVTSRYRTRIVRDEVLDKYRCVVEEKRDCVWQVIDGGVWGTKANAAIDRRNMAAMYEE